MQDKIRPLAEWYARHVLSLNDESIEPACADGDRFGLCDGCGFGDAYLCRVCGNIFPGIKQIVEHDSVNNMAFALLTIWKGWWNNISIRSRLLTEQQMFARRALMDVEADAFERSSITRLTTMLRRISEERVAEWLSHTLVEAA